MAFTVFISHSTKNLQVVYDLAEHLKLNGIVAHVSEWFEQPGQNLPQKVKTLLESSDCVLTLLTIEGNRSRWVNQEIGYAEGKGKIIIPIVEVGVKVTGFLEGREYISFKRNEPDSAVTKAMQFLKNMASKKEQDTLIGGAILAGLILLFGLLALGALKSGKS